MPATVRRSVWNVFKDTINLIILPLGIKRNFNPHNKGLKMYNYIYIFIFIYVYIQVARRLVFLCKFLSRPKQVTYLIPHGCRCFFCLFVFLGLQTFCLYFHSPVACLASSFSRFLDHTQRNARGGRTPLDEWSIHRRDLYLTTNKTHNRQTSSPGGIRTRNLRRPAAEYLHLRPRGHCDRQYRMVTTQKHTYCNEVGWWWFITCNMTLQKPHPQTQPTRHHLQTNK